MTERDLFEAALELPPENRVAYLDGVCGGDAALRQRLEALLRKNDQAGGFLEQPAGNLPSPPRGREVGGEGIIPTVDEPAFSERPGTVIGPYKLLEQVGEGGFGVVFLAEQTQPVRRKVALKVLKPGMDTRQVIARFEAERQALALMDHPNIAKILDGGETASGRPYFVMELVRGVPITDFCDQGHLTVRARLEPFRHLCRAVQHAHQKGIIHRDLKPSNVLVSMHDTTPVVKVIDFGVAKALGQELTDKTLFTGFAQLIGTPLYMSPEQAGQSGRDVDTRSDVYSLGVLLYELLTGTTPFDKKRFKELGYDELRRVIREEEPPRPSTRISTLGPAATAVSAQRQSNPERLSQLCRGELDWIVMKALEKDRNRRYESAGALAKDVERFLADEAVEAGPPSAWYRLRKLVRRHQAAAAVLAVIAATLVAATGVSWAFAVETRAAAREAGEQAVAAQAAAEREGREKEQAQLHLYIARVQIAQHAWRDGNVARVKQLLDEMRPGPGQRDLRGFESHYLWRLAHTEPTTLRGHEAEVSPTAMRIALSTDGRYVASTGQGGRWDAKTKTFRSGDVQVWDLRTGRIVRSFPSEDGFDSAVALGDGGRLLARPAGRGDVEIWDLTAGRKTVTLPGGHSRVSSLAFSRDGTQLAVGHGSGHGRVVVKVWDVATGKVRLTLPGHESYVYGLAFNPDGKRLATCGLDQFVRVWDTASGEETLTIKTRAQFVPDVAFSPAGTHLAGACRHVVKVWDAKTGEELQSLAGHAGHVSRVAFSPDGKRLASGSNDRTVKVWDLATGREAFSLRGHTDNVWGVAFIPDGTRLVSSSSDGTVKVWDARNQEARDLEGCMSVAFSRDGRRIAHGGPGKTIVIRDVTGDQNILRLDGVATTMAFSPDGKRLVTAGYSHAVNKAVQVWDATTGKPVTSFDDEGFEAYAVAYSPDNRLLAASGSGTDGGIHVWDTTTFRRVLTLRPRHRPTGDVAFSPTGDRLAVATGAQVVLWSMPAGNEVQVIELPSGNAGRLAFSPDGRWLAVATGAQGHFGRVSIIDLQTGREVFGLEGLTAAVTCVAFSPDGQRLAAGTGGFGAWVEKPSVVEVWELRTGQPVLDLDAGLKSLWSVAFSPDGNRLACAGLQGIRIWDAAPLADR
jgi:WD40 repeat protein/serine/threonine protein kinase